MPDGIRGFGHVKLANLATAQAQWKALTDRWHGRVPDAEVVPTTERKVIPMRAV